MYFRGHNFPEGDAEPKFCLSCGALYHPQMDATCLERPGEKSDIAPEPKRREMACDDADTISRRLAELAKEREPAQEIMPDYGMGDCCG